MCVGIWFARRAGVVQPRGVVTLLVLTGTTMWEDSLKSYQRVGKRWIPMFPCHCEKTECVYNEGGICDEPRINYGNSDAECFRETPRSLVARLQPVKDREGNERVQDGVQVDGGG